MLRHIIVLAAFLLALAGVLGSFVFVQTSVQKQMETVQSIIRKANENF
ncbi:MAG: hypothetical protein GX220_08675 [Treponema sp.]|nr:hypothetical protein [Treponema sp.]